MGDNSLTGGHYNWSSPLLYNGYVYIGIASLGDCPLVQGQLLQVDLTTHQIVNTFNAVPTGQVGAGIWTSPSVDPTTNTIYVSTGTEGQEPTSTQPQSVAMVALDASTLALKSTWQVPGANATFDYDWGNTPLVYADANNNPLVTAFNKNGYVYAFNRTNLAAGPVWQQQIARAGGSPQHGDASVSSPALGGGRLYMAGGDDHHRRHKLCGLGTRADPTTGSILWQRGEAGPVFPALTYANGLVIDGQGSTLEVLDAASGASLYSYTTGNTIYGAPTVLNGRIFVGSNDGNLYAFGAPNLVPSPTATATGTVVAPPQYAQGNNAVPQSSQSSVTVKYAQAQAVGDLNVVAVGWNDASATVASVTDSAGNSYQVAVPQGQSPGPNISRQAIYYAKNIAGSASNTITVTFSQAAVFPDIRIMEYANVDKTNPFDGGASAGGTGSTADSGAAITTSASDLLVGAGMTNGVFSGAGSGYTTRMITSPDGDIAEDRVVSATGSYHATAPVSDYWLMQLAAFRAAGTSTTTPTSTPTTTPILTSTPTPTTTPTSTPTNTSVGPTTTPTLTSTPTMTPTVPTATMTPVLLTPTYVQSNSADPQSPQSSLAVGYSKAQTVGDLNVVAIGWNDTTATISAVRDSAGNSYAVAVPMGQTTGMRQAIYYAKNIVGSATNTITVTFSQAAVFPDIRIMEYANVDKTNPFDGGATGSGTSSTATSGNVTLPVPLSCWSVLG